MMSALLFHKGSRGDPRFSFLPKKELDQFEDKNSPLSVAPNKGDHGGPLLLYSFEPVDNGELSEQLLIRLRRRIYQSLDHKKIYCHREFGRLATGRAYFFLQPFNAAGFLFESSQTGWIVTRASKIVHEETFIRNGERMEQATLLLPQAGTFGDEPVFPRVASSLFQQNNMAFSLYEMKLIQKLQDEITH